ncbi:MAG: hypothetical protein JL50_03070 [Peptococcaceae bacterium BICA1-7]|nr:MAG: hypothetical protein JL50_03070 [Peptococcaceae bacterium BICA1-7]
MDHKIAYYALALSILTERTPEQAFDYLETDRPLRKHCWHKDITEDDKKDMAKLKKTMTYKEIGAMYGISAGSVYNWIRRGCKNERTNLQP